MQEKKITGLIRSPGPTSDKERQHLREIRENVLEEIPPRDPPRLHRAAGGIGAQLRSAREAQGLSWYALAENTGVLSPGIIRDIEYGREVTPSDIEAVAAALGLKLELVESGQ